MRNLKLQKAEKPTVDAAVKLLLSLKADYKNLTGNDWKPGAVPVEQSTNKSASVVDEHSLLTKISEQGDKVRKLKSEKADKGALDTEVKILLNLKNDYKTITGKDWKPGTVASTVPTSSSNVSENEILEKITAQGDKIRRLKSEKSEKSVIDLEVKSLLELKAQYKTLTGKEWKPGVTPSINIPSSFDTSITSTNTFDENSLLTSISTQGDKVRKLKSEKADKAAVDVEIKLLLNLKSEYKTLTGKDWKPGTVASTVPTSNTNVSENEILEKITKQGDKIRKLKSEKSEKSVIDSEVKALLELKTQYKNLTGKDWKPGMKPSDSTGAAGDTDKKTDLMNKVTTQGDVVRNLKSSKAPKVIIGTCF